MYSKTGKTAHIAKCLSSNAVSAKLSQSVERNIFCLTKGLRTVRHQLASPCGAETTSFFVHHLLQNCEKYDCLDIGANKTITIQQNNKHYNFTGNIFKIRQS
jgi:hypothetical protein